MLKTTPWGAVCDDFIFVFGKKLGIRFFLVPRQYFCMLWHSTDAFDLRAPRHENMFETSAKAKRASRNIDRAATSDSSTHDPHPTKAVIHASNANVIYLRAAHIVGNTNDTHAGANTFWKGEYAKNVHVHTFL